MRAIPVDAARVRFIATGKGAARAEYVELSDGSRKRSGNQATDDKGLPLWVVDVLVDDPEADRAEVVAVRIASTSEPVTRFGQELRFVNLVAFPYLSNGRVALSFRADGIDGGAKGSQGGQAA